MVRVSRALKRKAQAQAQHSSVPVELHSEAMGVQILEGCTSQKSSRSSFSSCADEHISRSSAKVSKQSKVKSDRRFTEHSFELGTSAKTNLQRRSTKPHN